MLTAFWTGGGREWAMQVTKADYDMMMMMIQGLENELYWLRTAAVEQAHQNGPLPVDAGSPTMGRCSRPRIRTLSLLQHSFRLCRPSKQSDRWMRGTLAWQFFHKHAYCRSLQAFDNNERKVPKQKKASSLWKGWKCQFPSPRFFNQISARHMDPTLQQTEPHNGATYRQLDFTSKSYSKYLVAQHNQ